MIPAVEQDRPAPDYLGRWLDSEIARLELKLALEEQAKPPAEASAPP